MCLHQQSLWWTLNNCWPPHRSQVTTASGMQPGHARKQWVRRVCSPTPESSARMDTSQRLITEKESLSSIFTMRCISCFWFLPIFCLFNSFVSIFSLILVLHYYSLPTQEQRVFFMRSKFFLFGKRLAGKRSLREMLTENDPLQFDAEMCEPNEENYNCNWFATMVWKGKKPIGEWQDRGVGVKVTRWVCKGTSGGSHLGSLFLLLIFPLYLYVMYSAPPSYIILPLC